MTDDLEHDDELIRQMNDVAASVREHLRTSTHCTCPDPHIEVTVVSLPGPDAGLIMSTLVRHDPSCTLMANRN